MERRAGRAAPQGAGSCGEGGVTHETQPIGCLGVPAMSRGWGGVHRMQGWGRA